MTSLYQGNVVYSSPVKLQLYSHKDLTAGQGTCYTGKLSEMFSFLSLSVGRDVLNLAYKRCAVKECFNKASCDTQGCYLRVTMKVFSAVSHSEANTESLI